MATTEATDDKALLEEARANYKVAKSWWEDNQSLWLKDAKFRALDQWPADVKKKREADGLPCLVVDKLNQYVKQVVNDGRQNRPAIKVRPVDDGADVETAEGIQGLVRAICNRSNAPDAYDTALDHAAGNGFGFIRLVAEYAHENTFHQELAVRRVRNPLSCMLAPHEMADGSDAEYGFAEIEISKKKYKKLYPQAKVTNFEDSRYTDGWSDSDNVKVCEYYYRVEEPRTLHLLDDGTSCTDEDYQKALAELGPEKVPGIKGSREIPVIRVKWCRFSGAEILEKKDWFGKYIPIFPVYGDESDIEGKVTYSGLIRLARDPQILHNFSRSAFAQRVALTPSAPWMVAEGQIEGYEEQWKGANKPGTAVLTYKPTDVEGKPIPPPQRVSPSDIPAGFAEDMQMSEHDIQGALGMYASSIGEKSNEKSGKAIMARQREGDTATFHYPDNLNRTIRHLGRAIVDAAPHVYDGTRMVRLLGEDGTTTEARIDPRQEVAHQKKKEGGKELSIFNLNVGVYDVDISTGPAYTTRRQEAAEGMAMMIQADPSLMQSHGDLVGKMQDWPMADEWAERSKMMLPPHVIEALRAKETGTNPEVARAEAQAQQMMDEAKQAIAEREQALMQAQDDLKKAQDQQRANELKAQTDYMRAETERMKVEAEISRPEAVEAPVDNSVEIAKLALDQDRLRLEDEWKKLEAATKVTLATIQADSAVAAAASTTAPPSGAGMESAQPAGPDTSDALAVAIEGFTAALGEMRRPRVATMPDGRQIRIQ